MVVNPVVHAVADEIGQDIGIFLALRDAWKVCIDSFCWLLLSLPGHYRIWLVSSHSCWCSKHLPSCLLSKVCNLFAVGSKSFIYLDIWMCWPMLNCHKFAPIGCHAMLS